MRPRRLRRGNGTVDSIGDFIVVVPIFRAVIAGSFGTKAETHSSISLDRSCDCSTMSNSVSSARRGSAGAVALASARRITLHDYRAVSDNEREFPEALDARANSDVVSRAPDLNTFLL